MRELCVLVLMAAMTCSLQASWYWPFGSDAGSEKPLRISELMEPVTALIDEAADLAADGKVNESVEKYRAALTELDRIEMENPDRAKSTEFATLRNKRAYVNAAIDSMLLGQVKANARAVAVSDTTDLEAKLASEKGARKPSEPKSSPSDREQAMEAIAKGDYPAAEALIERMLQAKPNGAAALNMRAAMEAKRGNFKAAESALNQAITSNPRNHFAYYNMAHLMLQIKSDNKRIARLYYETGREVGGPVDERLEEAFK